MYTWVIYDIRKNKTRTRVAKRCKFYGLERVQKSVFLGKIKGRWLRALNQELIQIINHRTDRIFIVPLDREQLKRIQQAGTAPPLPQLVDGSKSRFI
ncbi:MAG: CRISPR-associated endonuclease Cas2 [Lewinellaceae bacterium]|nr:CRISPR-associated endonuclease Cas2 [Lewinellaceae bacterium]